MTTTTNVTDATDTKDVTDKAANCSILYQLQQIVSPGNLITDSAKKIAFETEWRGNRFGSAIGVIFPTTVSQIQQIINLCQTHKIGLIPQGGNTSTCAGAVPLNLPVQQLIINLSKLNKILELNLQNNSICVEAGCTLQQVNAAAIEAELYFPLSIGSSGSCQIGGNIATNAGGIHVIKYGMMRNLVLGLEAVLPDGSIVNQLHSLRKNNINFDLKQLFIGSEGTLGIVTKATLKLFPQVQNYFTALLGISSITNAINLLNQLSKHYNVCAFEVINNVTQQIYNTYFANNAFAINDTWLILFELEIDNNFDLAELTKLIQSLEINLNKLILASNEKERNQLWSQREHIPLAEKMSGVAIKHDISLPINNIEKFIHANEKSIHAKYPDAQIIIFGHLGDGNLHYNIQPYGKHSNQSLNNYPPDNNTSVSDTPLQTNININSHLNADKNNKTNESDLGQDINLTVYDDVYAYGGSFSAEHGIGYLKKSWMYQYYDNVSYNLAQNIKNLIDPHNILNPGKVFKEQ